jgi:hypothetical protein
MPADDLPLSPRAALAPRLGDDTAVEAAREAPTRDREDDEMKGAPMTVRPTEPTPAQAESEAMIWIDHDQALVVASDSDGPATAEVLERQATESESAFEERALGDVLEADRVLVSGPVGVRTSFERAYVAITHRPDRLVDVESTTPERLRTDRDG